MDQLLRGTSAFRDINTPDVQIPSAPSMEMGLYPDAPAIVAAIEGWQAA